MTKQEIEAILEKIEASEFPDLNWFISQYRKECNLIRSSFLDNGRIDELTIVQRIQFDNLVKGLDSDYTSFVEKLKAKDKACENLNKNAGLA